MDYPTQRPVSEHHFTTHDGVELFYRHWPATGSRRGAVVMFHRGHEHSGRMSHLVDELDLPDFDVFAWDARGHGRSPGERGFSPSFGTSVRDVQTFVDHIRDTHGVAHADMAVLAQSVGAVLVSTWAHDYAPRIRALVLASPAFKVKLYVPFARPGLRLMQKLRGNFFVNSYVKAKFLTHDPARQASYDTDPLITRPISVNILLGLYEAAERVVADAAAITLPTQMLISGADWVVEHQPQHDFFERLGSSVKEKHVLDGFFHDTLGEADRDRAVGLVRGFILRQFDTPAEAVDLNDADKQGFTFEEARTLAEPYPEGSFRGWYWKMYRKGLGWAGMVSEGVSLGQRTGFDSGSTLDYVYRNEAKGAGPIGRMVDRNYLDAIGWRGIRQRKLNLEALIKDAMRRVRADDKPVRVLDIAAGHGRYVLDALSQGEQRPGSVLLRDYSDINVRDGGRLIETKGMGDIARFVKGNAFDTESVASAQPGTTIGIVSGLYELFPDNDLIRASLAGMAGAIQDGGYLIYTGQPWHPQLEMIARALTSHREGEAWVMRRRTQAEMDQLVREAGFEKIDQRIDEWGIFTVSLARRVAK
ncbi:bifunctional alpha/beta hydrolase/class I SAM-dependent methyltransferase [Nitrogeniibacter aestuarii]|uniref:bifunctional alpha/beta hydrolase/class I SAM-dependent methyltransferase n=1 Tax=Nitrogeniibacter aestuarii TaxID=2815343 RepID=UPI001E3FFCBA|nr:bifunctional alpha/beta hydrolase/class I SAM-dependent methyltransferase [Nitrogeniibacter aestuarii]